MKIKRPWGYYITLFKTKEFKIKILCINPDKRISLQYHLHRNEIWTILRGIAYVTKGLKFKEYYPFEHLVINKNEIHRVYNSDRKIRLLILEIQYGDKLIESDIVRLDDDYKR